MYAELIAFMYYTLAFYSNKNYLDQLFCLFQATYRHFCCKNDLLNTALTGLPWPLEPPTTGHLHLPQF